MPSSTSVVLTVRGVDATRAVFRRVRANVALMAAQVRTAGLAATGAAAAVAAVAAAIQSAAKQFGTLSDRAAQAGTSARDLNALVTGLGIAGAKGANLEAVADALSRMTKATGATGVDGLRETLASIAAIGDEGGRINALSATFGRAFGPGLAALVRQGPDAARAAIDDIIASGPRLSDSVVAAGDAIADGMSVAWNEVKTGWNESWVEIGKGLSDYFDKPARRFWADLGAYVRYGVQVAFRWVAQFARAAVNLFSNFSTLWEATFGGEGLGGVIAGWLLKAWNNLRAFGEDFISQFALVKDGVVALFTDDTIDEALQRWRARVAKTHRELAEDNAAADAMFGGAGWDNIREAFRKAGVTLNVDTSDLKAGLASDRERNASGIFDRMNDLGALFAGGAGSAVGTALAPLRDAKAVLAGSYEAFRIASQRGGSGGGSPVERAQLATEKNTATLVRNSERQTRLLEKTASALADPEGLYTLEG